MKTPTEPRFSEAPALTGLDLSDHRRPGEQVVEQVTSVAALEALVSRTDKVLDRFRPRLEQLDLEDVLAATDACGARIIVRGDDEWPLGLDDLEAPPHCLWVRGPAHLGAAGRRSVAIVGARAATAYGETVAADLGAGMAERDVVVVSGGAFGIDAAHIAALWPSTARRSRSSPVASTGPTPPPTTVCSGTSSTPEPS